jgi:glycosyltransferase involved in cell wall biosynthesis
MTVLPKAVYAIWANNGGYASRWASPDDPAFIQWLQSRVRIPRSKVDEKMTTTTTALINQFAFDLYRMDRTLQARFPDPFGADRLAYARWFVAWAREQQIPTAYTQSVEQALAHEERTPLRATRQAARRSVARWVTSQQGGNSPLYRLFKASNAVLEAIRVSHYFEALAVDILSEKNVLPLSLGRQNAQQKPFGVNVIGYISSEWGLGRVSRDIIRALGDTHIPVTGVVSGTLPSRGKHYADIPVDTDGPYAINLFCIGALTQYVLHDLDEHILRDHYNIAFFWWELNRLPPILMHNLRFFNEIWVGSHFVKAALEPLTDAPVRYMPIPVPQPRPARPHPKLPADKHVFLFVFDPYSHIPRKNPLGFIEAYRRAFGPGYDDTLLVLKTKNLNQFPQAARAIRRGVKAVDGLLIDRSVSRVEVDALFAACDVYVSLHRAEGYGLTIAEAMLLGKPVIATGYSGNMDFMTPDNSFMVPYALADIQRDDGSAFQPGEVWADPDLDAAAGLMRYVRQHPDEARAKATQGARDITRHYSEGAFLDRIMPRLGTIRRRIER